MADYKSMYLVLFRAMTDVIAIMQGAQQQSEEIYLSGEEHIIMILDTDEINKEGDLNTISLS